jgi:hypothetical protein
MDRDPEEIQASLERMDSFLCKHNIKPSADWPSAFNCFRPYRKEDIDHVVGICEARSDMHVIRVNYADVIERPHRAFETLRLNGIPIDPDKAAAAIDPKLYRIRSELSGSQKDCS